MILWVSNLIRQSIVGIVHLGSVMSGVSAIMAWIAEVQLEQLGSYLSLSPCCQLGSSILCIVFPQGPLGLLHSVVVLGLLMRSWLPLETKSRSFQTFLKHRPGMASHPLHSTGQSKSQGQCRCKEWGNRFCLSVKKAQRIGGLFNLFPLLLFLPSPFATLLSTNIYGMF